MINKIVSLTGPQMTALALLYAADDWEVFDFSDWESGIKYITVKSLCDRGLAQESAGTWERRFALTTAARNAIDNTRVVKNRLEMILAQQEANR